MPPKKTTNRTSFFQAAKPELQKRSGKSFLSSPYPSVEFGNLEIRNNIETSDSGDKEEVILRLELSLLEAVQKSIAQNPQATRWFDNKDLFNNLRIRVVAGFSDINAQALDFVSHRIGEYQAGFMSINGTSAGDEFVSSLAINMSRRSSYLLSPSGPFGGTKTLNLLKGTPNKRIYYMPDSAGPLSDIAVYDSPISSLIVKGSDGKVRLGEANRKVPMNGKAPGSKDLPSYYAQNLELQPVEFSFGPSFTYTDTSLKNIRFYAFTYLDYDAHAEGLKLDTETVSYNTLLSTGMGFIRSGIYTGEVFGFDPQEKVEFVTDMGDPIIITDSPLSEKIVDKRDFSALNLLNIKQKMFENPVQTLRNLGGPANISSILKTESYFSDFWVTKCQSDNAGYGFVFDKLSFLIENSELPWLYTNPAMAQDLLNGGGILDIQDNDRANIVNVTVSRHQINEHRTFAVNDLTYGTSKESVDSYYRPEKILPSPSLVQNIAFSSDVSQRHLLMYEGKDDFSDELKTQSQGTYKYKAKVLIRDPSINYLRKISKLITGISLEANEIYEVIVNSSPAVAGAPHPMGIISSGIGLYSPVRGERLVPLGSIAFKGTTAANALKLGIQKFTEIYLRLSGAEGLSANTITKMFTGMVSSKDPSAISEYARLVSALAHNVDTIIENRSPKDPFLEGTTLDQQIGNGSVDGKLILLSAEKSFSNLFEFGRDYGTGYSYLSADQAGDIPTSGLPSFSRSSFEARIQEEFNKYFTTYTEGKSLSAPISPENTSFSNPSFQYFSPKGIHLFGREPIIQTEYKSLGQNIATYDLDNYASALSEIVTRNHMSNKLQVPFYSAQSETKDNPRGVYNSLNLGLHFHSCKISENIEEQFSVPGPGEKSIKTIRVGQVQPHGGKPSLGMISSILGGEADLEDTVKDFLTKTDAELRPTSTGSYGAVLDPSYNDDKHDEFITTAAPPTKLIFGIIGELEVNPQLSAIKYQQEMFNSLVNDVNLLGLDEQSVEASLESLYSQIPNQYKSMFATAASQIQKSFGTGFDAVRTSLDDIDIAPFKDSISCITSTEDFPPYGTTRDPMKVYSKFMAFWMNYKQLGVVEYLDGFDDLDVSSFISLGVDIKENSPVFTSRPLLPVWKKFTADTYKARKNKDVMCRIKRISKSDIVPGTESKPRTGATVPTKDLFDLPIYSSYFLLKD
jgi:hypothetical protein